MVTLPKESNTLIFSDLRSWMILICHKMILGPFPEMEKCGNKKNVYGIAIVFCSKSCYNLWKALWQGNEYLDEL